jgi:hypothetical protein
MSAGPPSRMRDWAHGELPELVERARVVEERMKATRHVRLNGWCHVCGGAGRSAFMHVDATVVDGDGDGVQPLWSTEDVERLWSAALRLVAEHVRGQVAARLVELEHGHGCEGAAARAREDGRLQVVEGDMWEAVGLVPPAGGGVGS